MRVAKVKSNSISSEVIIPISSEDKPEITDEIIKKWQQIVDLAAKIIGVPSAIITRLSENELEIFLTNENKENIFEKSAKFELGAGWYCENVAAQRNELVVENALASEEWKDNPSVPFNMISYMGIPIFWPDGEVFGTFCMLDNKENQYSEEYKALLKSLKEIIQEDLKSIMRYRQAQKDLENKDYQIREVHHRVKNHFNLLINTISMQSFLGSHQNSENILSDIQARIFAVSSIHDKLYHSLNLESVSLGEYINELGKYIIGNLGRKEISYNCTSDDITVKTDISLTCGLLVNELITNSLKYAFEGIDRPEIKITLSAEKDNIRMVYKDNGCGLNSDFNIESTESLGMILIKQLVLQLGGSHKIYNDNGFVFENIFPLFGNKRK